MMEPLNELSKLEVRYERCIKVLMDRALDGTDDHARIAADVLLSADNHLQKPYSNWVINLQELDLLTPGEKFAVLGVIQGRVAPGRLPQSVIPNGPALMQRIWKRWINVEDW